MIQRMKKINIKGPIISNSTKEVYDYYGLEATCPADVVNELNDSEDDVVLEVNSPGGLVHMGSEIYTALKSYQGKVTANVVGIAASAASVIIMGADEVVMSPTAQIMIHKAQFNYVAGNSDALEQAANALNASDRSICNAYHLKTQISHKDLLELMANETFMDADKAIELGFADRLMFDNKETYTAQVVASIGNGILPQKLIDDYYQKETQAVAKLRHELDKDALWINL